MFRVPHQRQRSFGLEQAGTPQLDVSTVNAFGSADIVGRVVNADYNEYIHERLTAPRATARQKVMLCPPGSYLSGMNVRADHVVREISSIRCSDIVFDSSGITALDANKPSGITTGSSAPITAVNCPSPALVTGVTVRAGAVTDNVQLVCNAL